MQGNLEVYGNIAATGNLNNTDTTKENTGNISITAGKNVSVYGEIHSSKKGEQTVVHGVENTAFKHHDEGDEDLILDTADREEENAKNVKNPNVSLIEVNDIYSHVTNKAEADGNISITSENGNIGIYYGNEEKGFVDTEGNLNITANSGNVYVDSDLNIKGNLEVTSPNETVIDITNIGKVQNKDVEADKQDEAIAKTMHEFLHSFYKNSNEAGAFIFHTGKDEEGKDKTAENSNVKITVDLWDGGKYDLDKYTDTVDGKEHSLVTELENLDVRFKDGISEENGTADVTYIWVADGAQLNGISSIDYKNYNEFKGKLNFALKNDINATDIKNYQSIGGTNDYNGKFDGRDNRIIGLNTDGDGNSLFGTIGGNGQVKNLKVYSSNFDTNGAVAGTNNGIIDNVTGLGNHVTGTGTTGAVGGLVGTNSGTISSSTDRSSVTVGTGINSVGGLVGNNSGTNAKIENSSSNSAVSGGSATNVGGVVGSNTGTIDNADSLGITNGASNVGGIVGSNKGNGAISNVYNESIVIGSGNNIGGVAGINNVKDDKLDDDEIKGLNNVANAGDIKATDGNAEYIGGIIGDNNGTVDGGRNNARIEGNRYVGGIVGNNGENSDLHNITNDSSAFIVGEEYVGGIAGSNEGTITGEDINADESKASLINRGTITGQQYVGGVAGKNTGTIDNINSDISLNVKEEEREAKYFGGIAGHNAMSNDNGTIKKGTIKNATNTADVTAEGASYVGGIVGQNDGILSGEIGNEGNVIGKDYVGGVAGQQNNTNDISGTEDKHRIFTNSGTVEATNGGAGGIFGENTGNLTYVEMTNSGTVTGTDGRVSGTGGLIGVNSGNIKYSSLKNEVGGNVSGVNNVGGLIGVNKGEIEGGRTEDDGADVGYYKYQIYNNGTITGTGSGFNIGGLIGENQDGGSLTAGYNTGAISAGNSTNVGGIIGNNAGTVDQVFNTIMNKDGSEGSVTGKENVGGLIGTNSGTLSNAYNTSTVTGTTNVGNAIGNNENNGKAENIYATNDKGKLIGAGNTAKNSYTFVAGDTTADNQLTKEEQQKAEGRYNFTTKNDGKTWKFYDGSTTPLLKVFLTKVEVTDPNFVYNGYEQGFNVSANTSDLNGVNGVTGGYLTDKSGQNFGAHVNSGYDLIHANKHTDANEYDDWLYSDQIKSGGTGDDFNPNNLGYDIEYATDVDIDKAQITVNGTDVVHEYGSADNINNTDYNISSVINQKGEEIKDWDKLFSVSNEKDTALTGNTTGKITNDVSNDYTWNGGVIVDDTIKKNISNTENATVRGNSIVIEAGLTINMNDEQIFEGETPNYTGSISGLKNGDTENGVLGNYQYGVFNPNIEMQVGTHKGVIGIWIDGTFYKADNQGNVNLKNYTVKINPGTLTVTPIIHPEDDKRNWNNLLNDAPWDRNRDFRERKAEFNYTDGGVAIEKNDEDIVVEA
ncbi:beta strand repeat-containing protein [Megamonas hypermegale]|uniref:beta strand repeat-containing protein n=1 Tax=Megamonas hypermegale TaxID=158847 RepID=UPI0026EAA16A|nr:MBG domain-containing protein [Megamonas hypermegale]